MKKAIAFLIAGLLAGCSSGDLQIETIDFEAASVQYCGSVTTGTELFFKLNETEALILQLQSGLLRNEVSDGDIESSIPGNSQLTYRIFDANVNSGYFCDAIPPPTPIVLEEVEAETGTVLIATTRDPADSTRYLHDIRLTGVSFINSNGERLTNLSLEEFGDVATSSN